MKTKAKAALIAAAAIVGVAGGIWFSWCSGINYERRYKKLFDKTFKGDYKVTVTESGFTVDPEAPLKIPFRYKIYDIEYKDKNGKERHFDIDGRMGYQHNLYSDESLFEYIKNRNTKADRSVALNLQNELFLIVLDDAYNTLLPNYFEDVEREYDDSILANVEGCRIFLFPLDTSYDYIDSDYNNDDKMYEFISPKTCPVLSDIDWRTAADIKTYSLDVSVTITDERKYDLMDEYTKKAEALCKEFADASDFGGNYKYLVRTIKENGDETKIIDQNAIYVINGEKVDLDPNDNKTSRKFKDMIAEKAGYDTSEK